VSVVIVGLSQVLEFFRGLAGRLQTADGTVVLVGSPLVYARPVETGMRKGRPWRRAGPARMLQRGLEEELPQIRQDVRQALNRGEDVRPVLLSAGYRVQRRTQSYTPVRTGTLRRSFHTVESRR
jgi:hypothetical protein